jgi:hypothetical protein
MSCSFDPSHIACFHMGHAPAQKNVKHDPRDLFVNMYKALFP